MAETLSSYVITSNNTGNDSDSWCFNFQDCIFKFLPCNETHPGYRYSDVSSAWVLIAAIIVFFMKAGFLLVELAFAQNLREKRHVVIVKHLDAFASAFGFFLIGFDPISQYSSPQNVEYKFFEISDPILWFFKFTFASNAATIVGGCLVTNRYKLRLPAAFISAFVISGIIHPIIARLIWSNRRDSLSPYRFCNQLSAAQNYSCTESMPLQTRLYILDFAGGGAVHLLGGIAGLVLCLLAKLQKYLDDKKQGNVQQQDGTGRDTPEIVKPRDFWEWMYPVDGGGENTSEAALGVFILWFCWFAFNCGSTESVESRPYIPIPYHMVPSVIAVNMILAAASGGVVAVLIASWAQIRSQTESVNANEIANGVLSALVAITAGCPFVEYWGACLIGAIAVIIYHVACLVEYKFGIEDTARVAPVHGACGLWSLLAIGLFVGTPGSNCLLHATFEGLCCCNIRLPPLSYGERFLAQLIGAMIMIGITVVACVLVYGILFVIPIPNVTDNENNKHCSRAYKRCFRWIFQKIFSHDNIKFEGNLLFTGPGEILTPTDRMMGNDIPQLAESQKPLIVAVDPSSTYGSTSSHKTANSSASNRSSCTIGKSKCGDTISEHTPLSNISNGNDHQIDSNNETESMH